jgi:raffinose/stachyose/melibiose transport system permease protein
MTTKTAPKRRTRGSAGYDEISSRTTRVLLYFVAGTVLALILVPLAFAVLGGFRSMGQLSESPVSLPNPWVFVNYGDVLTMGSFWRQLFNSTAIALLTLVIVIPVASLAAFVLARFSFRGREAVYTLFTMGLLFPVAVAIVPLFIVIRQLHLTDSFFGVALPQAAFALPLSIVIMRPFLRSIPAELEEAAAIDGCSPFRFYLSVIIPLSRPALSTVSVLTIVTSWNAFLLPLVVMSDSENWTLPIGVTNFSTQYTTDTARVLAFTALSMIPALIFYLVAERQIVSGLASGAVKG